MKRPSTEERLIELESRYLLLESTVDELNRVLIEQATGLDQLLSEVRRLRAELRGLGSSGESAGGDAVDLDPAL